MIQRTSQPTPFSSKSTSIQQQQENPQTSAVLEDKINAEHLSLKLIQKVAEFTPLRLNESERVLLGVIEGALDHSEFTSNVDVSSSMHYVRETYDKDERIESEILEFCQVLVGLSAANDFKSRGKNTIGSSLKEKEQFFQECLEIGRRFKITNPDKMRDSYGKLLYLLMDASRPVIQKRLGLKLMKPVQTVTNFLTTENLSILQDSALIFACAELTSTSPDAARKKVEAQQFLVDRYSEALAGKDNVRRIISSLEDSLSFLRANRDPVDALIGYLMKYFDPNKEPKEFEFSLSLRRDAKPRHHLNHDHKTQFTFVLQSLLLWREVMNDFFRLWIGAEEDLLNPRNGYQLANTGQGMQRCQSAPCTARNMDGILNNVQSKTYSSWVGLKVVHLGDREVPNALIFIDKYTQVPRIIAPIVRCIRSIQGELSQNEATLSYLRGAFESPESCIKLILADLFRGGFDGGGGSWWFLY